ncbi:MAG: glycoside hydrolase family 3 C-terminal domain-containing protein [Promethearchaeia archaeon]
MTEKYTQDELVNLPFMDSNKDLEERVEDLLQRLTLHEKMSMLAGYTRFSTFPIKRLSVPEFGMTDGPHGVCSHSAFGTENTYFPAAITLAASWNPDLAYKYGESLGEETRAVGRHCILAPGINIHRTPLCGRSFEYFTEDPFLNEKLVVPLIKGIQSKRIAACVKHFICNNTEKRRRFSNSIVDKRALEEIYFPGFKAAIEEGDAWVVMGSYNKVNGQYVYEKKNLLKDKLQNEWGFRGFVVSDWKATHSVNDPARCIKAGFSLEMPEDFVYQKEKVRKAFENGEFSEDDLDGVIKPMLRVFFLVGLFDEKEKIPNGSRNTEAHLQVAREIIEEGAVLLKNEKKQLPLQEEEIKKICVNGKMADYVPFFKSIGGSSAVHPPFWNTPLDAFKERLGKEEIFVDDPAEADVVIHITGITHWFRYDSEGSDREQLSMPDKRIKKIKEVTEQNPNTIVVLYNGSPLQMTEWIDRVPAVLEVWQPHQVAGDAIVNLIFGDATPSGKLPTTFPKKLADSPAHQSKKSYPDFHYSYIDNLKHEWWYVSPKRVDKAKPIDVLYEEGIYVGYRYFDEENIEPLFPFGYGLSYTQFDYIELVLDKSEMSEGESMTLKIKVKNAGDYPGDEVVQVYAYQKESKIDRPPKELVGFGRVHLEPGQVDRVKITVNADDLAYYDPEKGKWMLEGGEYKLLIGSSSREIKMESTVVIK